MALKYAPGLGLHSHLGGVVLVWHKKSNTLSHSFQTNHHPITITIKCLSTTTTTTTTTTTVDVSTTITLCQCRLAPQLLLELMFQVIADNRLEMLQQRPHNMNRTGGWPPVSIELSIGPASSAQLPLPRCLCQCCLWQQILFLLQSPQQLQIKWVVSPLY